jgi:hypothetical protein
MHNSQNCRPDLTSEVARVQPAIHDEITLIPQRFHIPLVCVPTVIDIVPEKHVKRETVPKALPPDLSHQPKVRRQVHDQ